MDVYPKDVVFRGKTRLCDIFSQGKHGEGRAGANPWSALDFPAAIRLAGATSSLGRFEPKAARVYLVTTRLRPEWPCLHLIPERRFLRERIYAAC